MSTFADVIDKAIAKDTPTPKPITAETLRSWFAHCHLQNLKVEDAVNELATRINAHFGVTE